MSQAPSVVRSLFVTLKRSFAGTPHPQRKVLTALGLHGLHQCIEKPNNPSIRGMLMKVPHMVIVQTDRMFHLHAMKDYHLRLLRPPLVVQHSPAPPSLASLPLAAAASLHTPTSTSASLPAPETSTSYGGAAAAVPATAPQRPAGASTRPASGVRPEPRRTRFEKTLLEEHQLPSGMDGFEEVKQRTLKRPQRQYFAEQARIRRIDLLNKEGLWSPAVRRLNQQHTSRGPEALRVGRRGR